MLLAIETSCDDTSVAVVHRGRVLSNVVSSQMRLHAEYGGVVPELAARAHLRNFLPVAQAALREAGARPPDLEAIAATQGPGLPNALMVGFTAGQSIAFALRRPFLGIHHHEAHLYSPWISGERPVAGTPPSPCIASSARRSTMPRANVLTRWPNSSASLIPADRNWTGLPRRGIPPPTSSRARSCAKRRTISVSPASKRPSAISSKSI